jgi:hypothetical protein
VRLYFLVEGDRTEPIIYRHWVEHTFPGIVRAARIEDLRDDSYLIQKGGGYPSCLQRIGNAMLEMTDVPVVDHFFICVDAEEVPLADRFDEFDAAVREEAEQARLHERCPRVSVHVIVQNCCIETWLLGHGKMLRRAPHSARLVEMKTFYDVSSLDPEAMGRPRGFVTRQSFHEAYLKEMLAEQGKSYSKAHPGVVLESNYLASLRDRCATTSHLPSLKRLLDTWSGLR